MKEEEKRYRYCLYRKNKEFTRLEEQQRLLEAEEVLTDAGPQLLMSCNTWIKSSPRRTQILYRADISSILYHLDIRESMCILESGTGSLTLTYILSKLVREKGAVHTVEYNRERYEAAKREIKDMSLKNIYIYHRTIEEYLKYANIQADRIFLDVPEPEIVLSLCADALKIRGRICVFVPCIEQVQRALKAVKELSSLEVDILLEGIEIPHKPCRLGEDLFGTVPEAVIRSHTGYLLFLTKARSPKE